MVRAALLLVTLLAGCTLALPGDKGGDAASPLSAEAIEVTKLDAPKGTPADAAPPGKAAEPGAGGKDEPVPPAGANGKDANGRDGAPGPEAEGKGKPAAKPDPDAKPDAAAEPPPEPAPEAAPLSPEAQACKRKGGRYVKTGKGDLRACVRITNDAGKACRRETDCEGACLARSGTCAPQKPLFGCNEILQADGRRVTLCLD